MRISNDNIEILIDLPGENYQKPRFDWTGKITEVRFRGIPVTGIELLDLEDGEHCGKGLYNEFGIEKALGFEEVRQGGWFHKIGVGLLKKETDAYQFHMPHEIRPAAFSHAIESDNKVSFNCRSENLNGYAYVLDKKIELSDQGFDLRYELRNTGSRPIRTQEYNHNFICINRELMGSNYELRFPFDLQPTHFGETVNPEDKVLLGNRHIGFSDTPEDQFFFSNLSGGKPVKASWELVNRKQNIRMTESGDFKTQKVNLWGWKHVVSPELFFMINADPGASVKWSRTYRIEHLKDL